MRRISLCIFNMSDLRATVITVKKRHVLHAGVTWTFKRSQVTPTLRWTATNAALSARRKSRQRAKNASIYVQSTLFFSFITMTMRIGWNSWLGITARINVPRPPHSNANSAYTRTYNICVRARRGEKKAERADGARSNYRFAIFDRFKRKCPA